MSGRSHQRGLHHTQHSSAAANDASGWVESIGSLNDEHPATALLLGSPPTGAPIQNGTASKAGSSSGVDGMTAVADGAADISNGLAATAETDAVLGDEVKLSPEQEFEASLEHGLGVMMAEVSAVGEMMIEVGAPHGSWGPTRLTAQQLERVLTAMKDTAAAGAADVVVLRQGTTETAAEAGTVVSCTADVLVSRRASEVNPPREVRVAIIGNVDSGKSTLVGVLTRSMLDDGRGLARGKVFKHHHEESTGRTSSIGQDRKSVV